MTILEVFYKIKDLYKSHNLYYEKAYINNITNHISVSNIFYDIQSCILVFEFNNKFRSEFIEDILYDCFARRFCDKTRAYFNDLIKEDEEIVQIKEKLKNKYFTKEKNNKINFNSKRKIDKLKEFNDYYKKLYNELKSLINSLIKKYFNNLEIEKLIFEDEELSVKNYITEEGNYVHPNLALLNLSQIFNLICYEGYVNNVNCCYNREVS